MKTYLKNALLLLLLCYVAFTAGYIYKTERNKADEVERAKHKTYTWPIAPPPVR